MSAMEFALIAYAILILYGTVVPLLLSSQLASAILAVIAVKFRNPSFHCVLLVSMMAQLFWRGFVVVVS